MARYQIWLGGINQVRRGSRMFNHEVADQIAIMLGGLLGITAKEEV